MQLFESAVRLIFPPACVGCGGHVTSDFALCPDCWTRTPFISGLVCDSCGTPLPGEDDGVPARCDDCLAEPRPWKQGRAALRYEDLGRTFVLSLKHGDRLDLVRPLGEWLARAAAPLVQPDLLIAPIPLHWTRLLRRRYNQSALLSGALCRALALDHAPDLLVRTTRTPSQEGRDRDARHANVAGAINIHPRRAALCRGRSVLLVDDVMTSGATFAAATGVCLAAGAKEVSVLALARVAKAS